MRRALLLALALLAAPAPARTPHPPRPADALATALPAIRQAFRDWQLDNRVPGLVWGIVADGRLLHLDAAGIQDLDSRTPVTADTAFRIASMSKAFTAHAILGLERAGQLRLDDPAASHVPELAGWGSAIRVRHLLHHSAGLVTDDPWGDRQQSLPEADFTALLAAGVPFTRLPGRAYDYSNLGYAILGRIITNRSGRPFQAHIADTIFRPLGMAATTFEVGDIPRARLAFGYRFEGGRFVPEPVMPDGAFGAMGGIVTTANDYAKWIAHLLSDDPVVVAMREGGGFIVRSPRPGRAEAHCDLAFVYAGGLRAGEDCVLGRVLQHSGGYPGYGSHMLLLPDAGVGLFAFANRTYAAPVGPVWDAATALSRAGVIARRPVPVSAALAAAYAAVARIWATGSITAEPRLLAANMLLDRSEEAWALELARLKREVGACNTAAPIEPTGALSGRFRWRCTTGRIDGQLLLAPTPAPEIQALRLAIPS